MNRSAKTMVTILSSAAIGAAIGILFAPDEGAETRKKIVRRSRKLIGTVNEHIDDSKETLEEVSTLLQKPCACYKSFKRLNHKTWYPSFQGNVDMSARIPDSDLEDERKVARSCFRPCTFKIWKIH